jgi:hypothetical protein
MFAAKDTLLTRPSGGYQISRSVRLRSSASAYFNKTLTTPTNNKIWTYSVWVKKARPTSNYDSLFSVSDSKVFRFGNTGSDFILNFIDTNTGWFFTTTQVFRDPSAWMHLVLVIDTTDATAGNRTKVYVNGIQVTAFSAKTDPSQNAASSFNTTVAHYIGQAPASGHYFDGYMTEINFIDGQALTPSSFGETNDITGVWQPKKYGGTYGTNGFYLNFSDNSNNTAATIGKDYSGNGNNWTPNNISVTAGVTYDSMTDVPTLTSATAANYCTWNPIDKGSVTVTNGNLSAVATADVAALRGTMGLPQSGKWYWETTLSAQGYGTGLGIADNACPISNFNAGSTQSRTFQWGSFSGGVTLYGTNQSVLSGTSWAGASQVAANDVVMIAVDMDNGSMWVGKNGTWFNSSGTANPATNTDPRWTGLTGTTWFPVYASYGTGSPPTANANFGQQPFTYTPPTGFVALNTQNLPEPTISNGGLYMKPVLYTGTSPTAKSVTGVGFQPDFTWIKSRVTGYGHALFDSVRGATKRLQSNTTSAEATSATYLTSFDSDGFTVAEDYGQNAPAEPYVSWNWNAGGSTVTNTDGTISSQVRANPTAGCSVVTYTANNTAGATIGHGLGVAPSFIIVKSRNNVNSWNCYHTSLGNTKGIDLNGTGAASTSSLYWNNTSPTSSVFSVSTFTNNSTYTYVAYCFAAVAGYSAFGSYTGNGSTNGPFVFLGFRPRFVIIRRIDAGNNWHSYTSTIDPSNVVAKTLYPNTSGPEGTENDLDFVSNGMKMRDTGTHTNASGGTYIYMAWAENPFKNSLAR